MEVQTKLTAGTRIEIKRFGLGVVKMWSFDGDDALEIRRALNEHYDDAPQAGDPS